MECPYKQKSMRHVEKSTNDLVDEESGVCKGIVAVINETYEYCDCLQEQCAVWKNGKCKYNG